MKRALSGAAAVPIAGPSASYRRKVQSAVHQAMSKEINRVAQEATSSAVELAQQKNQSPEYAQQAVIDASVAAARKAKERGLRWAKVAIHDAMVQHAKSSRH